jgi:hypothetical protein
MSDLRRIAAPAYVVAVVLILLPLAEVLASTSPWRLFDARWRFGFFGVISNALLLPATGLFIAFVAATLFNQKTVRRIIGFIAAVAALICSIGLAVFVLDALQTRAAVRPEMQSNFSTAAIAAGARVIVSLIVCAVIARAALARSRVPVSTSDEVPLFSASGAHVDLERSAR